MWSVESVTTSINHSVGAVGEQNRLIEETKVKFDEMNTGVSELMEVINRLKSEIEGIADATAVIADGITGISANSEQVAAASNEGAELMEIAAEDMSNVNVMLTNIYHLSQQLKEE
jgi:methyl-accepting chemotaxis protein